MEAGCNTARRGSRRSRPVKSAPPVREENQLMWKLSWTSAACQNHRLAPFIHIILCLPVSSLSSPPLSYRDTRTQEMSQKT